MANEIGTTLLNTLTSSTFDIGGMAKVMAEAEVAGPRALIEKNQDKVSTELDALKFLETNLQAFKSYLTDLSSPDLFSQKSATSSDESVVKVTSTSDAAIASYQIESRQLAQAHTMVANKAYSSPSDLISAGTLNIQAGGQTHSIVVDATNNTLEGLQKVINNGDYGVTASIINNGGSYQMMFTSKQTGAAGEVSISGLSDFDTNGLTTTSEAQDAVMVLNGLTVTNSTNNFDQVIEGVSFQLNAASIGSPKTVTVGQDSQNVTDTVKSFVDVYNQLGVILDELGSYDKSKLTQEELDSEEYKYFGDLAGNSLLRSVKSQIESSLSGTIGELNSNYNSLSMVGISFDREGVLQLDETILNNVAATNMQALSNLFSKGGSSDDALVNVLSGTEKTQTGNYQLDITQLAERATVSGGAVTLSTDESVAGDRVTDATAALTIDAGASLNLQIGATANLIDLSSIAGTYTTKDEVAAQIQTQIDAVFGAGIATFAYDSSQARFEISSATGQGTADVLSSTGLTGQGFLGGAYAGQQLIDLSAADASFNVKIDESVTSAVTIQAGRYTLDELATKMTNNINSNTDVMAAGASVNISTAGGVLNVTSDRFGIFSSVELTGFANFANAGFTADLTDIGQNVDGTITTASGTMNIGAYADATDGRKVKVSDFAVISGNAAEVRGLEFEVLGGALGARGTITYAQGFASLLEENVNNLFKDGVGLVSERIGNLTDKMESYDERTKKIDARYEKLLLKYQMQFASLQSILSSSQQTMDYLSATFSNNSNN